ncbi:SRPBCC family protein, partial [Gordonia sp. N1V]|uniref:SRPBCC family protein n=1 Tax=Gordonia sp. N1V TaxID=3034163 RepID=UPI0023E2BD48
TSEQFQLARLGTFNERRQWPTGQIVCVSDHVTLLCMIPEGPDRTRVVGYWLFQQTDLDDPAFDPGPAVELFDVTNREDFDACERMQRNTTTSYWNSSQIYAPFEYRISSFRRWVEIAMTAPSITEAYENAVAQPSGWGELRHFMGNKFTPTSDSMEKTL